MLLRQSKQHLNRMPQLLRRSASYQTTIGTYCHWLAKTMTWRHLRQWPRQRWDQRTPSQQGNRFGRPRTPSSKGALMIYQQRGTSPMCTRWPCAYNAEKQKPDDMSISLDSQQSTKTDQLIFLKLWKQGLLTWMRHVCHSTGAMAIKADVRLWCIMTYTSLSLGKQRQSQHCQQQ